MGKKRVCVIGASVAGLCSIRHGIQYDCDVIAFEQNDKIGGLWIYNESIGINKYGLEMQSSLYKNLQTNLPKEVMGYPDFPFPEQEKSFLPAKDVLDYLNLYTDHFNLKKWIKFEHLVIRVRPLLDDTWEVLVRNLPEDKYETFLFDLVFVCNGHYHTPFIPVIEDHEIFKGSQSHSHYYKIPEPYQDQKVLVIGAGPSGVDIAHEISNLAEKIYLSHHLKENPKSDFHNNVLMKPDVAKLTENGAIFKDGSFEQLSHVLYCTGYQFTFPFLSTDCDLATDDNFVRPLYKHCLSINRPTMAVIGLPFTVLPTQMVDLQVRFCYKFMMGAKQLPTKEEMLEDTNREMEERWKKGYPRKKAHFMGPDQGKYYQDLAETADIEPMKPVILKIYMKSSRKFQNDVKHFREDVFRIIDDENFEQIK